MDGVNPPEDDERNPNALELEIEAERLVIRLDNTPAVIGAVADAAVKVGVVMAGGYLVYKLANTPAFLGAVTHVVEGLGEAFIEKVRAGSLEITLITENQQTAETIRQFYKEGILLQQFNIALRKYGRAYNDPQIAFTEIVLAQPENAKVGLGDLESLKKKADEEMKEASINGIIYEKNLQKSRIYVEMTTKKTVTTKQKIRLSEEEFQHEGAQAFSSRAHGTTSPHNTTSSRDPPTHLSETSPAASHRPHQERRKQEIKDIESVYDFLEIVKTDHIKKTSLDLVLDETLMLMMGYFQYYKLYMKIHKFDQVGVVKNKMLKLIENNFVASGGDIKLLADKIREKGKNYKAFLFYEISVIFYSRENSLNAAEGINKCISGIYASLEALSVKNEAVIKPITCDYVIPVMRDLLQLVQNMNKIEAKEQINQQSWCLHYIAEIYALGGENDSSLSTLSNARDLMEKTYGKDVAKYWVYGFILNSTGGIYRNMSSNKVAAKYFELAIEALKQATDFTNAEQRSKVIQTCTTNLSNMFK